MPPQDVLRIFLALELPQAMVDAIERWSATLQKIASVHRIEARWTKPEQYHATLRFFGDKHPDEAELIGEITQQIITSSQAIHVNVGSIGVFSSWKNPTILWLGLQDGAHCIQGLFHALDDAFADADFGRYDKPSFHPHITLARIKYAPKGAVFDAFSPHTSHTLGDTCVDNLTLWRSQLTPQGPIYTPIRRFALAI